MLNDLLKFNCPCSFDINTFFTILFNFLAVSFGVWLSFCFERKRRKKEINNKQIEFLKLIQSEILENIKLLKQMIDVEIKNNSIPAYQLQIFTKESIWHTLVEHHFFNLQLLQLIARSYFEYNFINRLLDMAINSQRFDIVKNNITPLVNGEIARSEELIKKIIECLNISK